jgi:basic membrane protein A
VTTRRVLLALLAINIALLVAGWAVIGEGPPKAGKGIRVGIVFDVGGKNDRSFNEAAYRGLERARKELGVETAYIEPSEGADREAAMRRLAARGYHLVIGVGFIFSPDLERLAKQFPNTKFAGVDYAASEGVGEIPNLVGLRFREHDGSFLVGAIAGMLTRTKTVGFVGGMEIPLIRKFEAGFTAGVKHVCPACRVLAAYAGSEPKAFADPPYGQVLASAQFGKGADIIYHAAGKTGDGVFAAARRRGARAIGVDSDQHDLAPCCIVTSMVKRVDLAVLDLIKELSAHQWHGGIRELGLKEGGVGFVAEEKNRFLLPIDVVTRANKLREQIIAGEITVPDR